MLTLAQEQTSLVTDYFQGRVETYPKTRFVASSIFLEGLKIILNTLFQMPIAFLFSHLLLCGFGLPHYLDFCFSSVL